MAVADYFLDDNWDDWDNWFSSKDKSSISKPKPLAINWAGQNILQMIIDEYREQSE